MMNGYNVIISKITKWAKTSPNIRAVILIGSRARDKEPTEQAELTDGLIINEINDYLYHCVWLVEKIKRGELWVAMKCLNCYMKDKLLHMIEFYTQCSAGKEQYTWYNGRMLERWTHPSIRTKLKGCFADYDEQSLKKALLHHMDVYHELALKTAMARNIPYPSRQREMIIQWIGEMLK